MEENNIQEHSQSESPAWKQKARPALYVLAALYVLYMAYKLFEMNHTASGNEKIIMIVFGALFLFIGVGLLTFAIRRIIKANKKKS